MRTSWMLAGLPEVHRIDALFGVTVREHGKQHVTNSPVSVSQLVFAVTVL